MRQIGTIENAADLERITDYLLTLGIRTHSDQEPEGFVLWAYDEDRIAEAKSEVIEFQRQPANPKYANAAREAKQLRAAAAQRERQTRRQVISLGERWNRPANSPAVTWILIAISVAVTMGISLDQPSATIARRNEANALLTGPVTVPTQYLTIQRYVINADAGPQSRAPIFQFPLFSRYSEVARGEVWRLVTPIFLHFSVQHIAFNMLSLAGIGKMLEGRYGGRWLLLFVLLSAVFSNVAQYLYSGPTFGGMSGVVYALFGFAWMRGSYDPTAGFRLAPNTICIMLLWL
ncbi:MAG: rhomboid family intramembrane serine protease, partial [Planctomycetota bacterium]|nr:rhomboid family intramembrane serine protease [Planctomycetota bacterium]